MPTRGTPGPTLIEYPLGEVPDPRHLIFEGMERTEGGRSLATLTHLTNKLALLADAKIPVIERSRYRIETRISTTMRAVKIGFCAPSNII